MYNTAAENAKNTKCDKFHIDEIKQFKRDEELLLASLRRGRNHAPLDLLPASQNAKQHSIL